MSKAILCIEQNHKHICFNLLGIKLRIHCRINKQQIKNFFEHDIKPNTILLIEPNDCHFETLLGLYKILKKLNYNVEILTRGFSENLLCRCNDNITFWECNTKTFDYIFSNFDFSEYYCLIFNSKRIYWKNNNENSDGCDIENCYEKIPQGKMKNIYLQHHLEFLDNSKNDNQIILANPQKIKELDKYIVNSNYFGEVLLTDKNKKTVFITVGELNPSRRNSSLLINAVENLHNKNITNFEIYIIGKGKLTNIKPELHKYFHILGRVDFSTMFNIMEKSDYFLPLLDPSIQMHQRYMKYGTSGSFQLIYGFLKPCIIHETFAKIYNFTENNSILYKDNFFLVKVLKKQLI